jgi:hypothetical protein
MNSMMWIGVVGSCLAVTMVLARSWFVWFYQRTTRGDWRWHARPATADEAKRLVWVNICLVLALSITAFVYGLVWNP